MSKDIKKALEHCVVSNCIDCPNKEELGSGETVCRGRLLPEVLEYLADLEAKLAESEKKREYLFSMNCEYISQIEELKQQLAEKDKQVKKLNLEAQKYYEDAYCNDFHNQDKISFCIERLEKVKDDILDISNGYWRYFLKNGAEYMLASDLESCLEEFIDNQIEELKKEMK